MCRTRDSIHHPQDSLCALAGRGFPGIDWILVLDYCASIKWYPSRWQCGSTSLCWAAACVVCKLLTIYCETISQHALNQSHPSNSRRPAGPDGRTDGQLSNMDSWSHRPFGLRSSRVPVTSTPRVSASSASSLLGSARLSNREMGLSSERFPRTSSTYKTDLEPPVSWTHAGLIVTAKVISIPSTLVVNT